MLQCFLNQLVGVQSTVNGQPSATIGYVYDGNGNRYSKTVNGQTRYYSYDTSGNIVSEYKRVMVNGSEESQALVRYVRDTGGKAISMIQYPEPQTQNPVPTTYYFVHNGHGDVTALTDSTGTVVATYSYDEFGNITSSTGTVYNPLRYSGAHNAYYDSETSLYKMGTRYYQSNIGRWLTRDGYRGEQENPQSQNKYIYVENNPINMVDPSGFKAWPSTRRINKNDEFAFRQYIKNNWHKYIGRKVPNSGGDCADLAITLLVDFASQRKVSLDLKGFGGRFDSNAYHSKSEYLRMATAYIGAESLAKLNTKRLSGSGSAQPGDMVILEPHPNQPGYPQYWDTKNILWKGMRTLNGRRQPYFMTLHQNPDVENTVSKRPLYLRTRTYKGAYENRPRRWSWQ